jgi:hypothetical protein
LQTHRVHRDRGHIGVFFGNAACPKNAPMCPLSL